MYVILLFMNNISSLVGSLAAWDVQYLRTILLKHNYMVFVSTFKLKQFDI